MSRNVKCGPFQDARHIDVSGAIAWDVYSTYRHLMVVSSTLFVSTLTHKCIALTYSTFSLLALHNLQSQLK